MDKNKMKQINDNHGNVIVKQLIITVIALIFGILVHTGFATTLHFMIVFAYLIATIIPIIIPCLFLMKGLFTGEKEAYEVAKATGIFAIPAIILFIFI